MREKLYNNVYCNTNFLKFTYFYTYIRRKKTGMHVAKWWKWLCLDDVISSPMVFFFSIGWLHRQDADWLHECFVIYISSTHKFITYYLHSKSNTVFRKTPSMQKEVGAGLVFIHDWWWLPTSSVLRIGGWGVVDVYAPKWVERERRLPGYPDFPHWAWFPSVSYPSAHAPSILVTMSERGNVLSSTF